jgi:hypothetical protein
VGRFSGKEVDASFADICIPERSACQPVRTRHSKKHWSGRPEESLISLQSAGRKVFINLPCKDILFVNIWSQHGRKYQTPNLILKQILLAFFIE